jgi:NCAIR mutase (PurE)-related protein
MDPKKLKVLLDNLKQGKISVKEAMESLKNLPFEDLGYAKVDTHRALRRGAPEVVYCPGKSDKAIAEIFKQLGKDSDFVLGTKATRAQFDKLKKKIDDVKFFSEAGIICAGKPSGKKGGSILVISAGTSDIPVAEEAAITAEILGSKVERLYDVGVAGIHRLMSFKKKMDGAKVIVVIAGMEGALPSVVSGMTEKPVIAVPTSVGYGASFDGLAALLAMMNSCSPGVVVVNIDNGFGAGYFANIVNKQLIK